MWIEPHPVPGRQGQLVRPEPFGGTIAFRRPEMLVLVDHAWLGSGKTLPLGDELQPGAPFEAHLTLGHECRAGCAGCYIDAQESQEGGLGLPDWKNILQKLAGLGVYHLALGGGESLDWGMAIELAHEARRLGMTPNFSTAGLNLTAQVAKRLSVFERIHVSLDGLAPTYELARGHDGFHSALMSLKTLQAYHRRVGVNCVVSKTNADKLPGLFGLLSGLGVRNLELLRFKPVGRGRAAFEEQDLTPAQAARFLPRVLGLARRFWIRVRLDCSFTPMVCAAGFHPAMLSGMGLAGCVGGSWLVSIDALGRLAGCSFDTEGSSLGIGDLGKDGSFDHFLEWTRHAPEPCASCDWLSVCRGGCHVVARHVTGSFQSPDPGCPVVRACPP